MFSPALTRSCGVIPCCDDDVFARAAIPFGLERNIWIVEKKVDRDGEIAFAALVACTGLRLEHGDGRVFVSQLLLGGGDAAGGCLCARPAPRCGAGSGRSRGSGVLRRGCLGSNASQQRGEQKRSPPTPRSAVQRDAHYPWLPRSQISNPVRRTHPTHRRWQDGRSASSNKGVSWAQCILCGHYISGAHTNMRKGAVRFDPVGRRYRTQTVRFSRRLPA